MRLVVFFLVFLLSCSSKEVPDEVLEPAKMKAVLFDMIRVDEFATNYIGSDTAVDLKKERMILYHKVFALHNTTKETFYNSYKYYQQNPDKHKQLFDSLMTYGKKIREVPLKKDLPKLRID